MPTTVQFRRGTTAQNLAFTGALGEISIDTDLDVIRVHDGSAAGGHALVGATATQTLTNKTLTFPVIDNIKLGYTTTATAAGTTTLTATSNRYQRFTGSTTQTIVLPVTSTLVTGVSYEIENASTGNLTVNSSGGNLVITIIPGVSVQCMCIGTALTTAADWDPEYNEFAAITGSGAVVLATSPTLVTPTFSGNTSFAGNIFPTGNANANIGSTTLQFNTIHAKATSAQYADLAEKYIADADYIPGTVVVFGGEQEITTTTESHDTRVAGVISTNPAYLMNSGCNGLSVALQGRVPCQVKGPVCKGDLLVTSDIPGVAQKLNQYSYAPGCVVGKSLENFESDQQTLIEIVVGRL